MFSGPAGDISPDAEQAIPTYEDVLALPPEHIAQADYRMVSDVRCIYVETAEDDWGYTQRYWVSVDTGLLVVAERLQDGRDRLPHGGAGRRTRRLLLRRPSSCRTAQTCFTGKQRHPRIFRTRGCFFENSETEPAMPNAARLVLQSMEGKNALQK